MNEEIKKKVAEEALERFPEDWIGTSSSYYDGNESNRCFFTDGTEYGYSIRESVDKKLIEDLKNLDKFDLTEHGKYYKPKGEFIESQELETIIEPFLSSSKQQENNDLKQAMFSSASKVITKSLNQENNEGWISVEDRLPNEYEMVLIWAEKSPYISTYTKNEWLLDLEVLAISEQNKITHWMPLPQPPKEK